MAGWSKSKDDLELKEYKLNHESHSMSCYNLDFTAKDGVYHDCKDTLKSLFDQVMPIFLREVSIDKCARPLPALLSNGQPVNLFRLFYVVKKKGGYCTVSENDLWASVAKECGFSPALMSSIKLVYIMYLKEFNGWLRQVYMDTRLPQVENVRQNVANTYDNDEKFINDYDLSSSARRIVDRVVNSRNKVNNLWPREGTNVVHEIVGNIKADCGKVHVPESANVDLSLTSVGNPVVSRKRKWKYISLPGILNWITQVAKRPDDPAIGAVPGSSKWKDHGTKEYWVQALLAREALLIKRPIYADLEESSLQKKQKMHPSMYEDKNGHKSAERVRYSKRFPLSKFQFFPHCNPGHATPRKLASPCKAETHDVWKLPSSPTTAGILSRCALDVSREEALVSHVSVGLSFQAEIPEWTGVASESDSKWLGIQMWAPEDENNKTLIEKHPIGKGRQRACDCSVSGSSACVRFHIAEKRLQLKLALGVMFYRWKFDRMGEEVSLSWTTEEEKRFKAMVLQDSTGQNKFWNNAFGVFPYKTRENLVSYYFNVLVLRRRSYQNRITPKNVDSDDDKT